MSVLIARSQRPLSTRSAILRRSAIQRRSETNISETIKNERSKFGDQAIQTLVVDNFEAIRKLICSALKERAGIEVVGEAEDGLEALHQFDELKPNLVMLDLDLPKLNGLEVAKSIRRCSSDCKIVFLTLDIDPQVVLESFNAGANAYLVKTNVISELCIALQEVFSGRRYLSDRIHHISLADQAVPEVCS